MIEVGLYPFSSDLKVVLTLLLVVNSVFADDSENRLNAYRSNKLYMELLYTHLLMHLDHSYWNSCIMRLLPPL